MTARRFRDRYVRRRLGAGMVLVTAILVGVEAGARAQQSGEAAVTPTVANGVTAAGVNLSGLTTRQARAALEDRSYERVTLTYRGRSWRFAPQTLGAQLDVDGAVESALAAPPRTEAEVDVAIDRAALARWTSGFARTFDVKARNATIVLRHSRPHVRPSKPGRKLYRRWAQISIAGALRTSDQMPVELPVRTVRPEVTNRKVGPAIVVARSSNRLTLYRPGGPKSMRVWRKFRVATGQAIYPTPLGSFTIATKQLNPWWYPPDSPWAAGASPIPPGPGNPLGTRWMGLSDPLVGIHGTPDSASIGYSASHGCIRMLVSDAEWLYERVREGTPVYILPI
jgi:lipoprotein-anchoring transpeptidase ErfK/SrfK